jgi:hypothetical protein
MGIVQEGGFGDAGRAERKGGREGREEGQGGRIHDDLS